MIAWAKESGLGSYRRTTMLSDIRSTVGLLKGAYQAMRARRDDYFPRNLMQEIDLGRNRRYRVFGQASYMNLDTGQESLKAVSFYTDSLMSPDEWQADFVRRLADYEYGASTSASDLKITGVQHNIGFQY